jgi:hypothetical protein
MSIPKSLIADDAYAMSFQTMGQYRTALLRADCDDEVNELAGALEDCLCDLEYLAKAPDSAYARPDDTTIERARKALAMARGEVQP